MGVLHLALILVAQYGSFILIRKLDDRWFIRPEVRERTWNYASWGAAVYFEFKPVSFLAWGWVSRFRFDRFLARRFEARRDGRPAIAHVVLRAVLGLLTGVVETILFVIVISLLEYLCVDILGLPPFGGIGGG
jgi:hypothetical protein